MTAASNSEARKRIAPVADPVDVVARAVNPAVWAAGAPLEGIGYIREQARTQARRIVAALRTEGLL